MKITHDDAADDKYDAHWHVLRHAGDDDPFASYSLSAALDYAAREIDQVSEHVHEEAMDALAEKAWEDSANAYNRSEQLNALASELSALHRNSDADASRRAPLYRDEPQWGPRWLLATEHLFDTAEVPDDFALYRCTDTNCRPGTWVVEMWGDFLSRRRIEHQDDFLADQYGAAFDLFVQTTHDWADASDCAHFGDGSDMATVESLLSEYDRECENTIVFVVQGNDCASYTFSLTFDPEALY